MSLKPLQQPEQDADPERCLAEMEGLHHLGIRMGSMQDPAGVLREACEGARDLLGADCALVGVCSADGDVRWSGGGEPWTGDAPRVVRPTLEEGRPVIAEDLTGSGEGWEMDGLRGARTVVAVPLRRSGRIVGALLLGWWEPVVVSPPRVQLACKLGEQVAVAWWNASAREEMRHVTLRRDRFFSAMSHDLRTPITAVLGYSELLLDGVVGEVAPRQREMIDRIFQVGGHLARLVDDVLDLAKLDAGRMEFHRERTTLGLLVEDAVLAVDPQANGKALPLRLELNGCRDAPLWVDRVRVRQVLVNLLSNAVGLTPDGEIRLSAGTDGERTWIAVRDTGPGLPAGGETAVFEECLQLASGQGTKREPGSGLGLAVSRRLARAMGGDLIAQTASGAGATFTLFLPLRKTG